MYYSLQAGRAIAAILVVLFHLGGAIANSKYFGISGFSVPFSFGSAGVEFFFVLSGFIIFAAHKGDISKPQKLAAYVKKRIARIYPTYWIIFIAIFILAIAVSSFRNSVPHDLAILIKAFFLIPQHGNGIGGTGAPVVAVAWTLQYEMFFYACFAALILNKWLGMLLGLGLLCLNLSYTGESSKSFFLWFVTQDYILLFMLGMVIAIICEVNKVLVKRPIFYIFIGSIVFVAIALDVILGSQLFAAQNTILYGLASSIIIFGLVQAEVRGCVIGNNRVLQMVGNASYSLYLIHNPLIVVLCKIFLSLNFINFGLMGAIIAFILIFCICIATSIVFHLWIEKPIAAYLKSSRYF